MSSHPVAFWSLYAALVCAGVSYSSSCFQTPSSLNIKESAVIGISAAIGATLIEAHSSQIVETAAALALFIAPATAASWAFSKILKA